MRAIRCGFRRDVVQTPQGESARCELLQRVMADATGDSSRVDRTACEYCYGNGSFNSQRMSQVLGSAILSAAPRRAEPGASRQADSTDQQLRRLATQAVDALESRGDKRPSAAIDVVLPLDRWNDESARCVDAWMKQLGVYAVIHLVCFRSCEAEVLDRFRSEPAARVHTINLSAFPFAVPCPSDDRVTSAFCALHWLASENSKYRALETPFVAIGSVDVIPEPNHLIHATSLLYEQGMDWYATSLRGGGDVVISSLPNIESWTRSVQPETVVMRRALWVDLNGMAARCGDADVDFFDRATRQRRAGVIGPYVGGTILPSRRLPGIGAAPSRVAFGANVDPFELYREGLGFTTLRPKCDVVLPFRGDLDYVEQAIGSILDQEGVDLTLHLIDDATPQDIDAWLNQQIRDERVRVYRNRENIGQFLSFNNVLPYCESDWIVTQDGDDVSLPGRLADSIQLAVLCEAELVGAASVLDGPELDTRKLRHMTTVKDGRHRYHRVSFSPRPGFRTYFLENPTLVHRRQCFERLRGFSDLADTLRNRTTLDTDYMVRALHAGANIVASRRLAVRYRVHENSAIHHRDTRLGSPIRNQSQAWLSRRMSMYARGGIDPAVFGALGRHRGLTVPWEGGHR